MASLGCPRPCSGPLLNSSVIKKSNLRLQWCVCVGGQLTDLGPSLIAAPQTRMEMKGGRIGSGRAGTAAEPEVPREAGGHLPPGLGRSPSELPRGDGRRLGGSLPSLAAGPCSGGWSREGGHGRTAQLSGVGVLAAPPPFPEASPPAPHAGRPWRDGWLRKAPALLLLQREVC